MAALFFSSHFSLQFSFVINFPLSTKVLQQFRFNFITSLEKGSFFCKYEVSLVCSVILVEYLITLSWDFFLFEFL